MSDFENRLRDALRGVAGEAPAPPGLADGARRRARTRRRTVLATSAAAVAAAIAVPAALAFGGPDATGPVAPDPSPPVTSPSESPTESAEPSADGRVEAWRNLEIRVPDGWSHGSLSAWCVGGGSLDDRVVERPGGVVPSILCKGPSSGYGAQFFDPAAYDPAYEAGHVRRITEDGPFPEGSWVGFQYAGGAATADAAVLVVAPSEAIATAVLGSARVVGAVDANGCAPQDSASTAAPTSGRMAVCRYTADGWLEQSELLSPSQTAQALDAVRRSPETASATPCPTPAAASETPSHYVVLLAGGTRVEVAWGSSMCTDRGVFLDARDRRELTEDVMYWALSPGWSGAVGGDVPLPGELRQ